MLLADLLPNSEMKTQFPYPVILLLTGLPEVGDDLAMKARWKKHGADLRALEGKVVQLAIRARNADLYSLCFEPYQADPELPPYM